jgi:hypothetical protein
MKIRLPLFFCLMVWQMIFSSELLAQDKYWVFFGDKPNARAAADRFARDAARSDGKSTQEYLIANGVLNQRAIARRSKTLSSSKVVSASDFPVHVPYLDSLESIGLTVDGTSRWFNAAVVRADSERLAVIKRFPFVEAVRKVVVHSSPIEPLNRTRASVAPFAKTSVLYQPGDSSFYGYSYAQYELSGIPEVHSLGIDGNGVLIGMLDTGFRYETHDALKNIVVVGEHDFIQNDSITENQVGDTPDQDEHGTSTLSVIGGYSPGNIVGAAYGAGFMLAKTELIYPDPGDVDYKSEEDNWVEGIEWMEARGADVVSSSVAYNIFVDSLTGAVDSAESYFWSRGDFNGRTSIASLAATRAAELGVVVVQAMGNEGNGDGVVGTMDVPADADSIISVGAVDWNGILTSFSSTGPTNDGRIKPDLVADGSSDYVACVPGPDTYEYVSGTSLSTPITAGAAALILSVRPDFTPLQVINLLKSTAVQVTDPKFEEWTSVYPNDFYGWGIVNAWNAIKSLGLVGSDNFTFWRTNSYLYFGIRVYSAHGIDLTLSKAFYSSDGTNYSSGPLLQTDTLGQLAFRVPPENFPAINFYFSLVDSEGNQVYAPYYGPTAPFKVTKPWELYLEQSKQDFVLFNNYPNPFNSQTHITFALESAASVSIDVYDILGRKIRTINAGYLGSGYHPEFTWDGRSDDGQHAASGIYFVRVVVDGSAKVVKVLYLK